MKIAVILLVSTLAASFAIAGVSACETRTPGYWKNHPNAWPTITITDSRWALTPAFEFTMNHQDAMDILKMPVKGDASINLQQKVIAASLSILSDPNIGWNNDPRYSPEALALGGLPGMVNAANTLLNDNLGPWTPGSAADLSGVRTEGLALASQIDYWLNFFDVG